MQLKRGDVILFHGNAFISRLVRIFSVTGSPYHIRVNHTAIVVTDGELHEVQIVEALTKVQQHMLWDQYSGTSNRVAIFRPLFLDENEVEKVIEKATSYVGREYGYLKIIMHLLDKCIGGRYFFRRLTNSDKYPICSWVVAGAFSVIGENFGCDIAQAEPDDIWNYCLSHPEKYEMVLPLAHLKD